MFQGERVEIPLGTLGLTGTKNMALVNPEYLIEALNVTFENGVIQKEGGATKYNPTAISGSPIIQAGWDWWPTPTTQRMVVTANDGKLYKDSGTATFPTTLKTGLTASVQPMFVEFGLEQSGRSRKLGLFTGTNPVQVLAADGTTTTDLGAVAAPGAPVATLAGAGAGNVDNGTHSWKVTFVTVAGETTPSATSNVLNVVDKTTDGKVSVTGIPVGPLGTTARKLYRTVAGDTGSYKLVTTLSDNTTTVYEDDTADGSLGANAPSSNTAGLQPVDWSGANQPSFGLLHENRLWGGGNPNDPHRLYFSTVANHEDFRNTGSGTVSLYPGEGERLIGAVSFKGLIIAWKYPSGIYAVDTSDTSVANWRTTKISSTVGGVSPLGAVLLENDVLFVEKTSDIHSVVAVQEYGNVGGQGITQSADLLPFLRDNLALGQLSTAQAIYYVAKREVHYALAGLGSAVNNRRLVIDLNRAGVGRFRWSERDTCSALWLRKDAIGIPRPMAGDNAGFVWHLDQATRSRDGAGYLGEFQTAHLDLSHINPQFGTIRKLGKFLELVADPVGNWIVTVKVYWDQQERQTIQFNFGTVGFILGSGVLGVDALGTAQVSNRRRRLVGSGRRFSIRVSNSNIGEDFALARAYLEFSPGDERT
jgi:hypothetical protein